MSDNTGLSRQQEQNPDLVQVCHYVSNTKVQGCDLPKQSTSEQEAGTRLTGPQSELPEPAVGVTLLRGVCVCVGTGWGCSAQGWCARLGQS